MVCAGLNSKQIKNSLKKESCYPTIMTTARIQGVSKVDVYFKKSEQNHAPVSERKRLYKWMFLCKLPSDGEEKQLCYFQ